MSGTAYEPDREAEKCPAYSRCNACLCPLSRWLPTCVWSVDEEVCARRWPGGGPRWLKTQKRIAKRLKGVRDAGLFSKVMLEAMSAVGKATRGLSPDIADTEWAEIEKAWCAKRKAPSARLPSQAELEARARAGERLRKLKSALG